MRKTCINTVAELAAHDPRVFFIGSDLGADIIKQFEGRFPGRFYMEGISEAYMIGMAAGLALEGKQVYINTIGTFITRRCYEQIALDVCLHQAPVRLLGNGGGLVYSVLGPTHMATDDLALMRALPHMTILVPGDPGEMRRAMWATLDHPGPVYVRIARGGEPTLIPDDSPFIIGKALSMRPAGEALLLTTGVTLGMCLEAADRLSAAGVSCGVLHLPTLKPLDHEAILDAVRTASVVLTVEEHALIGGLGSAVAELLAEADLPGRRRFKRVALPDDFPSIYASQARVMARLGLSADALFSHVLSLRS